MRFPTVRIKASAGSVSSGLNSWGSTPLYKTVVLFSSGAPSATWVRTRSLTQMTARAARYTDLETWAHHLPADALYLPRGESIQTVHRHYKRNSQFPAQQPGSVAAWQGSVSMNQLHRMFSMQTPDVKKTCIRSAPAVDNPSPMKRRNAARWQERKKHSNLPATIERLDRPDCVRHSEASKQGGRFG